MMEQVRQISATVQPDYTFLVIDAMTGQDAVQTAEAFHATLQIDGVIMSKMDGDARGGAALSVKEVIGRPIAFASTGEKLNEFEQFHPDRMASRILGMGDMLTLIEQAERAFETDEAEAAAAKLMEGQFTLDDFLDQMQQLKKMGPLGNLMGMMPGMPKELKGAKIDDDDLKPIEAIIRSMTPDERAQPGDHQRQPAHAHRRRIGHRGRRRQPARQAVRRDAEDDEALRHDRPSRRRGRRRARRASRAPASRGVCRPASTSSPVGMDLSGLPGMPNMPGLPGLPNR